MYKVIFLLLFVLQSSSFLWAAADLFLPATRLSSDKIRQSKRIAEDIYTFAEERGDEVVNDIFPREVEDTAYQVQPFFGTTGWGEAARRVSCLGAVYQDLLNPNTVFVAHRGSVSRSDWETDFRCEPIELEGFGGIIHGGFSTCHDSFYPQIQNLLANHLLHNPHLEVFFIGHSLGGALSKLSAVKTARDNAALRSNQVKVISFSSPRVADYGFWSDASRHLKHTNVLEFHCSSDPFTSLPTKSMGFSDFGIPITNLFSEDLSRYFNPHAISVSEDLILRSFLYFQENSKSPSSPLNKSGKADRWSSERSPLLGWLQRLILG